MKKNIENVGARLSEINAKEVRNSRKNLEVINQAIGTSSALLRILGDKLLERYEEGDRRADAIDNAITALNDAICALEALENYERETINLCQCNG